MGGGIAFRDAQDGSEKKDCWMAPFKAPWIDNGLHEWFLIGGVKEESGDKNSRLYFVSHIARFDGKVGIGTYDPQAALDVQGDVRVSGDIFLTGADAAEEFNTTGADPVEAGTVMVIDGSGALQVSWQAYDKRVAGIVSGAGDFKPGIVLDKQATHENRVSIALVGKAFCKVDAQYGPIEVGDLLSTSPTSGHAMKAADPHRAFGAVIGKALRSLSAGQGLIPVLVALQ